MSSYFKFLRRVRIHGRECGAVARALRHKIEANPLSAADKKVLSTTNERKVMSNSTFFKRIALTAIAALGFGMLSVAPSQAVVTANTITIDSATDAITLGETATATITHTFTNLGDVNDSVTIVGVVTSSNASTSGKIAMRVSDSYTSIANDATGANSPQYLILPNSGAGETATNVAAGGDLASTNRSNRLADSLTVGYVGSANRSIGTVIGVDLYNPTAAGTYAITFYTLTSTGGATAVSATPSVTWTVTVTAPTRTATAASTSTLREGEFASATAAPFSGTAEGTDSSVVVAATASATDTEAEATILVLQKNGTTTNTALESMTVTVTGPAYVGVSGSARDTSNKAITVQDDVVDESESIFIWSDGNEGTATITVTTVSGVVIDTHTVTFYGDAAAISVAGLTKKVLRAGGFSNSGAFTIAVKDASGLTVTNESVDWTSSNGAIVANGDCASYSAAAGGYVCAPTTTVGSTSGQSVVLTARVGDPATTVTTDYITVEVGTFTLGGSISTVTLTTDKATYSPGDAMVVTATAVDSSGNPTYDGQAGPTWISSTKSLGGTLTMNAYYDGKSTSGTRSGLDVRVIRNANTVFAPNASGVFTLQGVYGTDNAKSASVSATVGDDAATAAANAATDAAAEAIDAANAATDAANLAAEAADAATVAAEEARDAADAATAAVEALATEVATLMAALKAQITTLANTVAKIAKKVKA